MLTAVNARDKEILVVGPAGTGKTRGVLEKIHRLCLDHDGLRVLIVRKTLKSMATSVLATLTKEVIDPSDPVKWFGGSEVEPASFRYENGSIIVVGGMDNPDKILSAFYDLVYFNEATEGTLEDWESLTARLRHGYIEHMRLIGDTNPSHDKHWLLQRCTVGKTRLIKTTHLDNPAYFNDDGSMTALGATYMATLQNLTGTRYQRLFLGEWVGMENAIYEALERDRHLVACPPQMTWAKAAVGIDYGTVHMSAVVVVQKDTSGRIWARECWTGGEEEDPIVDIARSYKRRYDARVGVVDPIPAMQMLANKLGFLRSGETTKGQRGSEGSRIANIMRVKTLLAADALRFDLNGEGIEELFSEAVMYRWLHKDTENIEKYIVDRHNDDRVAALEYAIEALETQVEAGAPYSLAAGAPLPAGASRRLGSWTGGSEAPRRLGGFG